jgi:hypothetical protein
MVKRAPVNVRYLWLFGEHILTRSFTARDPMRKKTSHGERRRSTASVASRVRAERAESGLSADP